MANTLPRIFASMCIRDVGLSVTFFSCSILVWLWYKGDAGLASGALKCSIYLNFLEEFERTGINSSVNEIKPSSLNDQ